MGDWPKKVVVVETCRAARRAGRRDPPTSEIEVLQRAAWLAEQLRQAGLATALISRCIWAPKTFRGAPESGGTAAIGCLLSWTPFTKWRGRAEGARPVGAGEKPAGAAVAQSPLQLEIA